MEEETQRLPSTPAPPEDRRSLPGSARAAEGPARAGGPRRECRSATAACCLSPRAPSAPGRSSCRGPTSHPLRHDTGGQPMAGASKATAKRATVADVTQLFRDSTAAVLTEYRGLSVAEITELRRA